MKNSGGSLAFNGQDNMDKPHKMLKQYDYNHSKLTPVTSGPRANLVGNKAALGKPSPMGDTAGNDHGPIVGTSTPKNKGKMEGTGKNGQLIRGGRADLKGVK